MPRLLEDTMNNRYELWRRICQPDDPHRNPKNGAECRPECYERAEIMREASWCKRHNRYATFTGSRGLTCGYPGQEECWIVPCVLVWMGPVDES